ncbi:hypothetical protein [Clostridium saccharobutylicum]|uniref:Uncharacterized protein n=1 Tax=Clostridium saccharobutylicum DSM 13864 TaxID=1345695 RepID=U5MZM9_CLOSA|nr:hypothetical protein [Clostridium saccharobutylicum]AGX45131.1 hypothetical protein CLSA_c41710 [Clostridium saccharobutylicum DSM 13864]AQR92411.1 hypothetical protein CLOSC_41410 [Clostridium saccharobutylicum]AQS02314.1 hypothetical protein CSACC_41470 [Clostridium saccharobutylicum]AQS11918.1 hypothetical protein CLOBY_40760 [Clostridium saccharobutylicum]AQS16297.1 hypothetical protein CLOSACC_41470 [Clostridium saccharobutylicum]
MASFDTPQNSTIQTIYATGTIPAHNDAGFIEIQAVASRNGGHETFYKTFQIAASATATTARAWSGAGNYQIVITPKLFGTQSVSSTTVVNSFKH